ncbi:MAG: hypothetical protein D6751_04650 [Deltaproteobacteria bacterium]|nr:MAG: hypothetical protein D6751_04650 [Deltaproteobacteria bacterium]
MWLFLLIAACAPVAAPRQRVEVDPELLLQALTRATGQAERLRGLAVVSIKSPEGDFRGRQALVAARPDRLRAEALSMFGPPLMVVATDGERLQAWLPGQNRFYFGRADGNGLSRVLRLQATPRQLVALVHHAPGYDNADWRAYRETFGFRLLSDRDGLARSLLFDDRMRLVGLEVEAEGAILMKAAWSRFDEQDGFPRDLTLEWPGTGRSLRLSFKTLELNPEIPDGLFQLTPPAGSSLYLIDGDDT